MHRPILFNELVLSDKLFEHCADIDEAAQMCIRDRYKSGLPVIITTNLKIAEIRKREERKDRLHQNYLKRKASGAQKRYEDKIKTVSYTHLDVYKRQG